MNDVRPRAIVIGAAAGAVQALSRILPRLSADYPVPLMIVVHIPDAPSGLVPLLAARSAIALREPEDKEPILPGTAYLAPPGYHLLIEKDHSIALSADEPVLFSRPSINVLLESAADSYGAGLTGIILTGANEDGANGANAVHAAGGTVLVENPATAYAPAMPIAALARCPAATILSLDEIADHLLTLGTA